METKDILKQLRKQKGFSTMQEFCAAANISFSTYQNYEAGKRLPTAEILMQIAKFYGVTTDYLLGMEPAPNPFADLGLSAASEQEMLAQYMSFPEEVRAILMDALIKLADSAKPETPPEIIEETTVGAELDRRAANDAEAEETAG
jgi:transcriptional regulator with XRE-family HTH domain